MQSLSILNLLARAGRSPLTLGLFLAGLLAVQPASAVLIVSGPAPDTSNAVQVQNQFLTLQGNGSTESACVLLNEITGADVFSSCPTGFAGGDETVSQSSTFSIGDVNIANPGDLRITFDAVESAGNSITIDRLMLLFWINPTIGGPATAPFTVELAPVPLTLATTLTGNGKAELVFRLDQTSIDALTLAGFNTSTIVGMAVNMSQTSAGPESFYLSNAVAAEGVPEPGTWALLTGGVAWLFLRRRTGKV